MAVGLLGPRDGGRLLERLGRGATFAAPDVVIRGGEVVDGTGSPPYRADVAVTGDRVTAVGSVPGTAALEIDARGMAVAPGFIDIHSHAELSLLVEPRAESRIRQGVTLEVVGQDGSSVGPWPEERARAVAERYRDRYGVELDLRTPGDFLDRLGRTPVAVNVATMVGHGTLRATVVGGSDRPATPGELVTMRRLLRRELERGAVGLSSGLEYTPGSFASTAELVELATELRGTGLPYASHMRNEDDRLLAAVEETLHVGRMAGVPVQVSHLKAQGGRNHWKADVVLEALEGARSHGVDVHFDRYPYTAYATGLTNLFPPGSREGGLERLLERLRDAEAAPPIEAAVRAKVELLGSWDAVRTTSGSGELARSVLGRPLGEASRELGRDPFEVTVALLEESGGVGMIGFGMSEENTEAVLAHPLGMVCSDGGAFAPYGPLSRSSPHPRAYGSFPRFLGRYVRERGILSLATAVHKITGMPAAKLGLPDRGVLRAGAFADVVVFDPAAVSDGATFTDPHRYPRGIPHVLVNGRPTLRDGEQTGDLAGRPVRGPSSSPLPGSP
jgi:N-acyl-D-amino-acid deacylase